MCESCRPPPVYKTIMKCIVYMGLPDGGAAGGGGGEVPMEASVVLVVMTGDSSELLVS